jgi:CysZ protein
MTAPWRGVKVVASDRSLWPYAALPAFITLGLLGFGVVSALWASGPFLRFVAPNLEHYWLLFAFARGAAILLLGVVFFALSAMVAALVCIPIHDALSQRVEARVRGVRTSDVVVEVSFREELPRSIRHSILGFLLWVTAQALLLPLGLFPVVGGALELVLGFGVTSFFLAHQLLDGPLSRRRLSFTEKMRWMHAHLGAVLGLGAVATFFVAIPILNAVSLPLAIAGGAVLHSELLGAGRDPVRVENE